MKKIKLTQGKFALVDNEDFDYLNQWKWCVVRRKNNYYAERRATAKERETSANNIKMHRVIINAQPGFLTDHKDHDGLNNQKCNLRSCNNSQNKANSIKQKGQTSSKYKGVTWDASVNKWVAQKRFNKKTIKLGRYKSEEDAAIAYDKIAIKLHGEFAYLNFPKEKRAGEYGELNYCWRLLIK